jgi:hypothetical protein
MAARTERRVPAILVLAAASAMVSVGVVAWLGTRPDTPPPDARDPNALDVAVDTSTPALAAESFLDAWRKRAHEDALALSTGEAHAAVRDRIARDEALSDEERAAKQAIWNGMAASRLALMIDASEDLPDDRVLIHGTAEGEFLDRPYARRVDFLMHRDGGVWKVERVEFGEILSDVPEFLELDPSVGRDPSEFEVRGENAP